MHSASTRLRGRVHRSHGRDKNVTWLRREVRAVTTKSVTRRRSKVTRVRRDTGRVRHWHCCRCCGRVSCTKSNVISLSSPQAVAVRVRTRSYVTRHLNINGCVIHAEIRWDLRRFIPYIGFESIIINHRSFGSVRVISFRPFASTPYSTRLCVERLRGRGRGFGNYSGGGRRGGVKWITIYPLTNLVSYQSGSTDYYVTQRDRVYLPSDPPPGSNRRESMVLMYSILIVRTNPGTDLSKFKSRSKTSIFDL